MSSTDIEYASCGDVSIAYEVLGDAANDLLLFTGFSEPIDSVSDEPSMDRFHRRLASFCRLIRFDLRGTGLSDPVDLSNPPTIAQWADDGLAVLDAVGSQSATVLSSWNIITPAITLAVAHPERVQRLVLINGCARTYRAPDYPAGIPREVMETVRELVIRPDAVERGFDALAIRAPTVAQDAAFRGWADRAGNRGASPATARVLGAVFNQADVRALLPLIKVPTLIVHRRDDQWTRVAHGRYLAERIPAAKYVELAGADDFYWVGDADAILDEIEEFLTGHRHAPDTDRVLSAVLFTDIVASTEQSARLGHRRWTALVDRHDVMVRSTLARYRGREIKTIGDGFLATFDATTRAVRAAMEIATQANGMGLEVRAGVHTGEIELRPDDVVGLTVSIAKRICDLAGPAEVFVSEAVKLHLVGSGIASSDRGVNVLKGVPDKWRLFAVEG